MEKENDAELTIMELLSWVSVFDRYHGTSKACGEYFMVRFRQ